MEGGGCSGFQYKFDLVSASEPDDLVIEREGARVLIDPVSLEYLGGSEIDFVDDLIGSVLQDPQPQRHRLVRLRDELLDLRESAPARCRTGGRNDPPRSGFWHHGKRGAHVQNCQQGRGCAASRPTTS